MELYLKNNLEISRLTTTNYSTSFSLGVRMLNPEYTEEQYMLSMVLSDMLTKLLIPS